MYRILILVKMIVISAVFSMQVVAHTSIEMTIPDNEATLDKVPESISIHTANKIRLTKVVLQYDDHEVIELDISKFNGFEKDFTIPIEPMGAGMYSISWRALGQDGHTLKGEFKFTVME